MSKKYFILLIFGICTVLLALFLWVGRSFNYQVNNPKIINFESPPRFVKHNFIDLDRVEKISKFRGGYAHDFSYGGDETCRSMKHYFWIKGGFPGQTHNPPWTSVNYYSPVDGTIRNVRFTQTQWGTESRFNIESKEYPNLYFHFFHVKLDPSLKDGSEVTSGKQIGTIVSEDAHGEIAVEKRLDKVKTEIISFFELIDENVFKEYKKRGLVSRQQLIISKEERDKNPLVCDKNTEDGRFIGRQGILESLESFRNWQIGSENWMSLN